MKIQSNEKIKLAEIASKQRDDAGQGAAGQPEAVHDREKHQADMIGKRADSRSTRRRQLKMAALQAKQAAAQQSADQKRAQQQFKPTKEGPR